MSNSIHPVVEQATDTEEVKATRKELKVYMNLFQLLYNSEFKGGLAENVLDALKYIDGKCTEIISRLPKPEVKQDGPDTTKQIELTEAK